MRLGKNTILTKQRKCARIRMRTCELGGLSVFGSHHAQPHRVGEMPSVGGRKSPATCSRMTAQPTGGFTMSKKIPLSQGMFAIVDDADFEWLNQHKWHVTIRGTRSYATRHITRNGRRTKIYMHCAILSPPSGKDTDHVNGDGLDNRRRNLRTCTRSQNHMNSAKRDGCSSIYKGVNWDRRRCKWQVQVGTRNAHRRHLGYFDDEQEAAIAYNVGASKLFGEFAKLNSTEKEEES